MFNILFTSQYEGGDRRTRMSDTMTAFRKTLKQIADNTYSPDFDALKFRFFISGECCAFPES